MLQEQPEVIVPILLSQELTSIQLSWMGTRTMSIQMIGAQGLAVSRAGHELLLGYQRRFEHDAKSFLTALDSTTSLTAIALRQRNLRTEVREMLARKRNPFFAPDADHRDAQIARHLVPMLERVLDQEEAHRGLHRLIGADMFLRGLEHLPPDHEAHRAGPDDVDDPIAYNLPLQHDSRVFQDGRDGTFDGDAAPSWPAAHPRHARQRRCRKFAGQ